MRDGEFQWAPTLGGECYAPCGRARLDLPRFNGHPPLGVNATGLMSEVPALMDEIVSMGTHPWG